jgi:Insertion element 4 transposase N-terminal
MIFLFRQGQLSNGCGELPSRVVVYLLLAAGLFSQVSWPEVWCKLTKGLGPLAPSAPSASAICQALPRVGVKPVKALFDRLRGPACTDSGAGSSYWKNLLVCAIDGTMINVPDSPQNQKWGRCAGQHGQAGYPQLRLVALVACGIRAIIDAVFGPVTIGETRTAPRLVPSLKPGMVLLGEAQLCYCRIIHSDS